MTLRHSRGGVNIIGTAADFASANPVLLDRQLSLETDTGVQKLGDGTTHYADLTEVPSGSGGGGGGGGGFLTLADPTGATVETTPNSVTGSGTIDVLTVPADTPVFAVKVEGDTYPRLVVNVDPGNFQAISLGDGTVDPLDLGAKIGLSDDSGVLADDMHLVISAGTADGSPTDVRLNPKNGGRVVLGGDAFITGGFDLILTSPSNVTYRVKVADDGTLSTEAV